MKRFFSLVDGLNYHARCPLCRKQMEVNDWVLVENLEYSHGHPYQRFTFYLGKHSDDVLIINTFTEEVEIKYSKEFKTIGSNNVGSFIGQTPSYTNSSYSGMFFHGLTISCNACCQYSYTLQLHVDLDEGKLLATYLNSETVSVEEGNTVHEIKNVYAMEKTDYACFQKDGISKRSSIPLIPLNLSDPTETVSRIRKLLIFS